MTEQTRRLKLCRRDRHMMTPENIQYDGLTQRCRACRQQSREPGQTPTYIFPDKHESGSVPVNLFLSWREPDRTIYRFLLLKGKFGATGAELRSMLGRPLIANQDVCHALDRLFRLGVIRDDVIKVVGTSNRNYKRWVTGTHPNSCAVFVRGKVREDKPSQEERAR